MLIALAVAFVATLMGVLLAVLPATSARLLGPIRTFALTASLSVVLTHLVPEGFAAIGAAALGVFALGALLPIALSWLVARVWRRRQAARGGVSSMGLEAGYAGLLVHKIADGVGLAAYAGPLGGGAELDVMIALAAHTVPVVAVVILAFEPLHGRRAALLRAGGIAVAMMAGVLLAGLVPHEVVHEASAWVAAIVSGLLLHVVMHDLEAHMPRGAVERSTDLLAAVLGFLVPALLWLDAGHGHEVDEASALASRLGRSFVDLAVDTAPILLVGLLAGAVIQSLGSRIPPRWLTPRGSLLDALRGAVVGAPLPLCACSVLPMSGALARRSGPGLVVAFLLATPELGVETFALSVRFFGWPFALLRLIGALGIAIVAGLLVARLASPAAEPVASAAPLHEADTTRGGVGRTLAAFDELLHHIGAWMVVGIAAAAVIEALIPSAAFAAIEHPLLELAVITVIAVPSYVCAPAATPLAAVLVAKGLSPGAVLVGLLLGPATNLATLSFVKKTYGARAMTLSFVGVVVMSWVFALGANRLLPGLDVHAHSGAERETHSALAITLSVLVALLLLRSIWLSGLRGWLASLAEIGGAHSHLHHPHDAPDHHHHHEH